MSRFLLRGFVTLLVLTCLYGGGLYIGKLSKARKAGEEYSLDRLPADMIASLGELIESATKREPAPEREVTRPGTARPAPVPDAAPVERPGLPSEIARGQELLDAGDFRGAIREWELAARKHRSQELDDDIARARLFAVVAERFPTAAERRRTATTTLMLRNGSTMEGRIKEEDEKSLTLLFPDGSTGTVPRESVVGREDPDFDRSPAELEVEYEDRARKIRAPFGKGYLDLARWCVGTDLTNHLTYLLERVRATESQEGAVLAKLLVDAYGEASAWDKDEIAKVLFRHYPHNTAVRAIRRARLGLPEPAVASSKPPRPLIGAGEGTSRKDRPRREPLTEDFLARVDLAKQHARKGREHYDRAQPDMPDRAKHRKLALIELRKARDIYDKLLEERDEAWLRSRLQDVYQMLYWMRKDQPAK